MGGWESMDEYVRYMVSAFSVTETARSLEISVDELRRRYPDAVKAGGESVSGRLKGKRRAKPRYVGQTVTCEVCGKVVPRTSGFQKYCPECAEARRIEVQREANRRRGEMRKAAREGRLVEQEPKAKTLTCARCGRQVVRKSPSQRYCPECKAEVVREQEAARTVRRRELRERERNEGAQRLDGRDMD